MNTETFNGAILGAAAQPDPADPLPTAFDSALVATIAEDADPFAIDPRFTTATDI